MIEKLKLRKNVKAFTAVDMFKAYKEEYPDDDISYPLFRNVLERFNTLAAEEILKGNTLWMGEYLGGIKVRVIKRNPESRAAHAIDFKATRELRAKGINKTVFFTSDDYCRWAWAKRMSPLPYMNFYAFSATRGKKGLVKKLTTLLTEHPHAKERFEHT